MERKTRSGKVPAVPMTTKRKGRKKKTEKEETEAVTEANEPQTIITPARRSARGKISADPEQSTQENSLINADDSSTSEVTTDLTIYSEDSKILEDSSIDIPQNVSGENSSETEDVKIPEPVKEIDIFLQTEQEIISEIPSNVVEPSPFDASLCNIEQQLSVVDLQDVHEYQGDHQLDDPTDVETSVESKPKSPEDIEMQEFREEPVEPEVIPEVFELAEQVVDVKIKPEEINDIQEDNFTNFMDIEDIPFVRRSRRLKSTHIEALPPKLEESPPSTLTITNSLPDAQTHNVDITFPRPESFAQATPTEQQNVQDLHAPDIQIKVENHDIRLQRYETIHENIYSKKSDKKVCKVNKTMKCDCTITEEEIKNGEVGCQYNCINRILYIECGPKCRCGGEILDSLHDLDTDIFIPLAYCDNQQFQRFNYSPCSVFETTNKGFGIRANNDIPAETFIMEYVGEVLDNKQFEKRAKKYSENKNIHYYFMALKSNAIIDATKKGNISRFINHSCDPNAETQKWTVNGELRVGFFSRKDIKGGDEITFDYQYQRYGKEAQKCLCEAPNCRGWIGENPLDEADEEEIIESPEIDDSKAKKTKSRKGRKPKASLDKSEMERESDEEAKIPVKKREADRKLAIKLKRQQLYDDLELQGGINDLLQSGLKNRAHTISLSRLVVRAKTTDTRSRLLRILIDGDLPCRRLFLDYNGLRLLHNWMCDIKVEKIIPDINLCIEMMIVLDILPITNKTVLRTSKVLDRVEKWKNLDLDKKIMTKEERKQAKAEKKKHKSADKQPESELADKIKEEENHEVSEQAKENVEASALPDENSSFDELTELKIKLKQVASELLEKWEELKEDFKIPKKQKQEIMIEHEREADNDDWDDEVTVQRGDVLSSDRYKNRFGDDPAQSGSRASTAPYKKQFDPIVSKQQRRQQFEMKVAQFDTEKRLMILHEQNCGIFGLNPITTNPLDVPVRVNRVTGEYNTIDGRTAPPPPNHYQFKYEPLTLSTNPDDYILPPIDLPEHWKFALDEYGRIYYYHEKIRQSQWVAPIKLLPLKVQTENEFDSPDSDESTTDTEDSEEEELKQLLEMLKRKKLLSPVEQTSLNNPLVLPSCDGEEDELEKKIMSNMMKNPVDQPTKIPQMSRKRIRKKKRHGLASMQFIRPRTDADKIYGRSESKRYKEVKEQLRQKKRRILKGEAGPADGSTDDDDDDIALDDSIESSRCVDELDILEKSKLENARSKVKKEATKKPKPVVVDQVEVKKQFRDEIKREIGKFLQPYRENTCENGYISNDIDFSCLVNKLTYSVLTKESKYCQSNNSLLKATDSVKGKTKEFIKKYMAKFTGPYQRKEDEQDYANILNKI